MLYITYSITELRYKLHSIGSAVNYFAMNLGLSKMSEQSNIEILASVYSKLQRVNLLHITNKLGLDIMRYLNFARQ